MQNSKGKMQKKEGSFSALIGILRFPFSGK
jgi:hypothetical protein